jgi:hypothetical protein
VQALFANPVDPAAEAALSKPLAPRGQRSLEPLVERTCPGRPSVHGAQDLDLPTRVQAEPAGQTVGDDVHHQLGDLLGILLGEQEEVVQAAGHRRLAGVDAVDVGDHPALLGLAEDVSQPHPW